MKKPKAPTPPPAAKPTTAPEPTTELDAALAERILHRDMANIVSKCKSGKPLSVSERQLIEQAKGAGPERQHGRRRGLGTAPNLDAAAHRLGVPVEVLQEAKRRDGPGFNTNHTINCDRVLEWLLTQPELMQQAGAVDARHEKALLIRAKRQREEFRLAVERKQYVLTADVRRVYGRMILSAKQQLYTAIDSIVAGSAMTLPLTAEQAQKLRQIIADHIHAALKELTRGAWDEPAKPITEPNPPTP